jgi:hypothetical protein
MYHKQGAGFISSIRSFPRLWSRSLSFERKHQSSKQWPKRPLSGSPLKISIYLASFRRKLQVPVQNHTEATFLLRSLDVLLPDFMLAECVTFSRARNTGYNPAGVGSILNYNRRSLVNEIEQLDYVRIPHPYATAAVRRANLVLVFGAMDVDEAVACIGILLVQSVEP